MIKKNRRIRHEDNVLMRKLFVCHKKLSKRIRDSLILSLTVVGAISTVLSILGVSLADWKNSTIFMRIGAVFLAVVFIFVVIYIVLDKIFKNQIEIKIQKTQVLIKRGDVFNLNSALAEFKIKVQRKLRQIYAYTRVLLCTILQS